MKNHDLHSRKVLIGMSLLLIATTMTEVAHAQGEVTLSGSTWTAKVDGSTKYTGSDMIDAINACTGNMGSGTINVRNSGTAVAPNGLRSVNLNSNQTLDFHGTTMTCENPLNVYPVKSSGKSNVAVRNLNIAGVPRYLLHFSGCSGVTISNITANTTRGTGIRVETSSNLVINGTIDLHTPGHCIETYTVNGVTIDKVTVQSDNGCGVLFNDSKDCYVNEIWAYNCNTGGSYAGFRQANNNGTTYCGYLRAKNCGRGLYVLSDSHSTTVDEVDIDDCSSSGISTAGTSYNVRVNSGTVSNSNKNIDIWDGAQDICIKVNGGSYGDACGGSGGNSGYFVLTNRNSDKCVDVAGVSTSEGANIHQWTYSGGENQQWDLQDAGSGYYNIVARHSGKCMSVENGSSSDGANIDQQTCNSGYWRQQFSLIDVGDGYYQIQNRNSGKCISVENGSSSDGANIDQQTCNSGYWRQQFSLSDASSARVSPAQEIERSFFSSRKNYGIHSTVFDNTSMEDTNNSDFVLYPNPGSEIVNIRLTESFGKETQLKIYDTFGRLVIKREVLKDNITVNVGGFPAGTYFINVSDGERLITKKFIK